MECSKQWIKQWNGTDIVHTLAVVFVAILDLVLAIVVAIVDPQVGLCQWNGMLKPMD